MKIDAGVIILQMTKIKKIYFMVLIALVTSVVFGCLCVKDNFKKPKTEEEIKEEEMQSFLKRFFDPRMI